MIKIGDTRVQIASRNDIKRIVETSKEPINIWVVHGSFSEPHEIDARVEYLEKNVRNYQAQKFDDVSKLSHLKKTYWDEPTKRHVEQSMLWSHDMKSGGNWLFCCAAGVSRSSATAYTSLCGAGFSPEEASRVWDPNKSWPNEIIVYYASEILCNPEVYAVMEAWKKEHYDPFKSHR